MTRPLILSVFPRSSFAVRPSVLCQRTTPLIFKPQKSQEQHQVFFSCIPCYLKPPLKSCINYKMKPCFTCLPESAGCSPACAWMQLLNTSCSLWGRRSQGAECQAWAGPRAPFLASGWHRHFSSWGLCKGASSLHSFDLLMQGYHQENHHKSIFFMKAITCRFSVLDVYGDVLLLAAHILLFPWICGCFSFPCQYDSRRALWSCSSWSQLELCWEGTGRDRAVSFPDQKTQRDPQWVANVWGNLNSAASIRLLRVRGTGPSKIGSILLRSPQHLLPSLARDSTQLFLLPVRQLGTGPKVAQFVDILIYGFSSGRRAVRNSTMEQRSYQEPSKALVALHLCKTDKTVWASFS